MSHTSPWIQCQIMHPMTNSHLIDDRLTDHTNLPVQLVKIDQMSQCILKSRNLTMRTDHWQGDQPNLLGIISFADNTDELETMKVDENWCRLMWDVVMGINGRYCLLFWLFWLYQFRQLNQTSKSWKAITDSVPYNEKWPKQWLLLFLLLFPLV